MQPLHRYSLSCVSGFRPAVVVSVHAQLWFIHHGFEIAELNPMSLQVGRCPLFRPDSAIIVISRGTY